MVYNQPEETIYKLYFIVGVIFIWDNYLGKIKKQIQENKNMKK